MRFYLISDNIDTQMGFRLAGIEGVVLHERQEFLEVFRSVLSQEDIGVVLVTEKLVDLCPQEIMQAKLTNLRPLIVEIPDRHGHFKPGEVISGYVRDAIGVKL